MWRKAHKFSVSVEGEIVALIVSTYLNTLNVKFGHRFIVDMDLNGYSH